MVTEDLDRGGPVGGRSLNVLPLDVRYARVRNRGAEKKHERKCVCCVQYVVHVTCTVPFPKLTAGALGYTLIN